MEAGHAYSGVIKKQWSLVNYLFVDEFGPEAHLGSLEGILRKQFGTNFPGFVDILKDHKGFSYGLPIMNKHRDASCEQGCT